MNAPTGPYGPATAAVRQFLVALAALEPAARARVVARFDALATTDAFARAEVTLGETVERSGRDDARDALAGPLLQIARRVIQAETERSDAADALDELPLDPIAEPALAALLALLVRDLLSEEHFTTLYAAFAPEIPAGAT